MRDLTCEELLMVDGGDFWGALASAGAGAGAARGFAAVAGITTGPVGAAVTILAGAAVGVALYYITD